MDGRKIIMKCQVELVETGFCVEKAFDKLRLTGVGITLFYP